MSSIRINRFAGLRPGVDARLLDNSEAQIAHNCLLTDGSLRALPQWVQMDAASISIGPGQGNSAYTTFAGTYGIAFGGPPFGIQTIYLDDAGFLQPSANSSASGTISLTSAGLSTKAVNRIYGVTSINILGGVAYESALSILSGSHPDGLMYEGDVAHMTVACSGAYARVYRSTSDVTTGAGTNGAVTANWQLVVDQLPNGGVFVDGGSAVSNPFDTYLYRGPLTAPFSAVAMGVLESGYVWLVSAEGQIAMSERFTWGIWPVENGYNLASAPGLVVTGAVSVGDRLYVGTQLGCFMAEAHTTDSGGVVLSITPVLGTYACIPNSMVASPDGAIYTCAQGVVSLSGAQAQMLSKDMARGKAGRLPAVGAEVLFSQVDQAFYHNGRYYAFGGGGQSA
jgi:hypothetical protein